MPTLRRPDGTVPVGLVHALGSCPAPGEEGEIDSVTVHVLLIAFVATLIRSAFGFGEALVAVPLLALSIPLREVAPLALLFSMTVASAVLAQDWKKIQVKSAEWLLLATIPGVPVGMLVLTEGHPAVVRSVLGLLILAFAVWGLAARKAPEIREGRGWVLGCGFVAGVLGGAYAMSGPPLVVYGVMRRWPAQQFRATLQAYFLPGGLMVAAGYWATGLWDMEVLRLYLYSLPMLVPAVWLGTYINRRLHGDVFLKFVYVGLAVIGAVLAARGIWGRV